MSGPDGARDAGAEVIAIDAARRRSAATPRCAATTAAGRPCRNPAGASGYCRVHEPEGEEIPFAEPRRTAPGAPEADDGEGSFEDAVAAVLSFLRRRLTGDYEVDVFGFDPELTEVLLLPLARPLYRHYWRVRTIGIDNVPSTGAALLVANHSGTLPFDAIMTKVALLEDHPARRHLRELAADLAMRLPFVGELARKTGNALASPADAERLLAAGELVGVWPEGYKGIGKPYRERYRLQRFGRGGFVEMALRTQTPIIPVAIVGAEEIYPLIGNAGVLARLLRLPYFPITPTFPWLGPLGAIPLPTRWTIEFGEPIDTSRYGPEAADDPMVVFELTDTVRDTIQAMLYRLLKQRRSLFF
ncbi:MAG TPA: lysophospholipid acyltransferase family protein [Egibacteraceae bacterium]